MTASSAATTRTTMSVTCAPRERIDVTHDRDDRWARFQILGIVLDLLDHVLDVRVRHACHAVAEFLDDQFRSIRINGLILCDHDTALHQRLDHIGDALCHSIGQFGHGDCLGQLHVAHDLLAVLRSAHGFLARALLLALHCGHGFLPSAFTARKRLIQGQLAGTAVPAVVAGAAAAALIVTRVPFRCAARRFVLLGLVGTCRIVALGHSRFRRSFCRLGGFACLALFILGLGLGALFGFALLALLLFLFGAHAVTLFGACLFLGFALGLFFDLA